MKHYINTLIVLGCAAIIGAETHITGDLNGMALDASGNPYIVEQDIIVPAGKKVVIKDGCVFLFKPFTGLQVQGQLVVEGKADHPVIFTSLNDGDFNKQSDQLANPFDWNGILVSRESGTVAFANFQLRYSVYGIKSQNPNIQINNGIFKQNGQYHFTINDKIQYVQDNIAFSYNNTDGGESSKNNNSKPSLGGNAPKETNTSLGKQILRYSLLGVGVIGVGAGAFLTFDANRKHKDWIYKSAHPTLDKNGSPIPGEYQTYETAYKNALPGAIIVDALAVLALTGFGLTFKF